MLTEMAWILKTIIKPKGELNCGLVKPEQQIPVLCSVMSCFPECLWRGELSPGTLLCPSREPTAESAQRQVASCPCSEAGHCLFGGYSPHCGPQQVRESHQNKILVKTSESRSRMERWRGWGRVPASPYLKKKKKMQKQIETRRQS